jgi:hypothetical protein
MARPRSAVLSMFAAARTRRWGFCLIALISYSRVISSWVAVCMRGVCFFWWISSRMWRALPCLPDAADDGSLRRAAVDQLGFHLLFLRFLFVWSCDRGRRSSACAFVFRSSMLRFRGESAGFGVFLGGALLRFCSASSLASSAGAVCFPATSMQRECRRFRLRNPDISLSFSAAPLEFVLLHPSVAPHPGCGFCRLWFVALRVLLRLAFFLPFGIGRLLEFGARFYCGPFPVTRFGFD